jgi:hypothetical protein
MSWAVVNVTIKHPALGQRFEVHVLPLDDVIEHSAVRDGELWCICAPARYEGGVVIHDAMDGRRE